MDDDKVKQREKVYCLKCKLYIVPELEDYEAGSFEGADSICYALFCPNCDMYLEDYNND